MAGNDRAMVSDSASLMQIYMQDVGKIERVTPAEECVLSRQIQIGRRLAKIRDKHSDAPQTDQAKDHHLKEQIHEVLKQLPPMQKVADVLVECAKERSPANCGALLTKPTLQKLLTEKCEEDMLEKVASKLKTDTDEARDSIAELDYVLALIPFEQLIAHDGKLLTCTLLTVPSQITKQLSETPILAIWSEHWQSVDTIGRAARKRLIEANLRLVIALVGQHHANNWATNSMDLIQSGNVSMIRAVDKFDYRRGYRFSTYSTWWIRQAIQRTLSENSRAMRLPAHAEDMVAKVLRVQYRLIHTYGVEPTIARLATELNLDPSQVEWLLNLTHNVKSLYSIVGGEDGIPVHETISDPDQPTPEDEAVSGSIVAIVRQLFDKILTQKEQQVIRMRFGIGHPQPYTLKEIGDELGMSKEKARLITLNALRRLRKSAHKESLREYWMSGSQ